MNLEEGISWLVNNFLDTSEERNLKARILELYYIANNIIEEKVV